MENGRMIIIMCYLCGVQRAFKTQTLSKVISKVYPVDLRITYFMRIKISSGTTEFTFDLYGGQDIYLVT